MRAITTAATFITNSTSTYTTTTTTSSTTTTTTTTITTTTAAATAVGLCSLQTHTFPFCGVPEHGIRHGTSRSRCRHSMR